MMNNDLDPFFNLPEACNDMDTKIQPVKDNISMNDLIDYMQLTQKLTKLLLEFMSESKSLENKKQQMMQEALEYCLGGVKSRQ